MSDIPCRHFWFTDEYGETRCFLCGWWPDDSPSPDPTLTRNEYVRKQQKRHHGNLHAYAGDWKRYSLKRSQDEIWLFRRKRHAGNLT